MIHFDFPAVAILSLLPESAFCFLRGNCRNRLSGYGEYSRFYNSYRQGWRQHRRNQDGDDYYYDPEEYPEVVNRRGDMARRSKREAEAEAEAEADYYYEEDASVLPAEHRQVDATERQQHKPSSPM